MEQVMPDFITYLTNERNASKSTVSSYCRDLERMFQFLDGKGIKKTDDVTPISLNSYILYLEKEGFSISTVSRNVASMKAYFHYAFGRRLIEKDPTRTIKAPHIEKRVPGVLTQEQVTRLLEQPVPILSPIPTISKKYLANILEILYLKTCQKKIGVRLHTVYHRLVFARKSVIFRHILQRYRMMRTVTPIPVARIDNAGQIVESTIPAHIFKRFIVPDRISGIFRIKVHIVHPGT